MTDPRFARPDYDGGSIVNLMASIGQRFGAAPTGYRPLASLTERCQAARRIALLVIDGLGAELLATIGQSSTLHGACDRTLTSVYPPTTASAISTFMTGSAPQQHGLTGWFMHFREFGAVTAVLPFMPRFGNRSLEESGIDIGAVVDGTSFFDRIDGDAVALMPDYIADSAFSRRLGGRAQRVAYTSMEDFATRLHDYCRADTAADFMYAYWPELDHLAHIAGPSSDTVARHFAALDAALAPAFAACADSGTLLIATADHGFIDHSPAQQITLDEHPELAAMLSLPLCGEPRTAYCYVRADCARAFEHYVERELHAVALATPSREFIADGWFGHGAAHRELVARTGDYILQMRANHTIADRISGERAIDLKGVHGGASSAEMFVPLALAGP